MPEHPFGAGKEVYNIKGKCSTVGSTHWLGSGEKYDTSFGTINEGKKSRVLQKGKLCINLPIRK